MGTVKGARPPSHVAYFVALAGILILLLLLCCYFLYFCIRRVKELASQPLPSPVKSVRPPPPEEPIAYPVNPGVRESATAMARLCQMPAHTDTVHPRRSPATRASSLPPPRILSRSISPHSPRSPLSPLPPHSPLPLHSPRSPLYSPRSPRSPFAPYSPRFSYPPRLPHPPRSPQPSRSSRSSRPPKSPATRNQKTIESSPPVIAVCPPPPDHNTDCDQAEDK